MSHYQLSFTTRQAMAFFIVCLVALVGAFFLGLLAGLPGRPPAAESGAAALTPRAAPTAAPEAAADERPSEADAAGPSAAGTETAAGRPDERTPPAVIQAFADRAAEATPTPVPPRHVTAPPVSVPSGAVWIQIASVSSRSEADALAARVSKRGYRTQVETAQTAKGKVFRVRVGPYRTEVEATHAAEKLRTQEKSAPDLGRPGRPLSAALPVRPPEWIRKRRLSLRELHAVKSLMRRRKLSTVCEEARCPNRGECFTRGTATFLMLGDVCTRACGFCDIRTGRPLAVDPAEPQRVADAAAEMRLSHVVLTSVDRDDLPDGGAAHFAAAIRALRRLDPAPTVEVLTPDFRGRFDSVRVVVRRASGRLQPQRGDRRAALSRRAPGRGPRSLPRTPRSGQDPGSPCDDEVGLHARPREKRRTR